MELRLIAAALLFNGEDLLMMKRSEKRTLNPGLWAAVGGHVEPDELAYPMRACMREIYEETGFEAHEIHDLRLRYILLRNNKGEFRQQFIYTGHVARRDCHATDEGELHWIPVREMLQRPLPYIFEEMLKHYAAHRLDKHVWMGTAIRDEAADARVVVWTPLTDPNY